MRPSLRSHTRHRRSLRARLGLPRRCCQGDTGRSMRCVTAVVGLAPAEFAWGDGTLTQAAVGWALLRANARARDAASPLRAAIDAEWRRFAREFPSVAERLTRDAEEDDKESPRYGSVPVAVAITAGYATAEGRLLPVRSLDRTRENVSSAGAARRRWTGSARGAGEHAARSLRRGRACWWPNRGRLADRRLARAGRRRAGRRLAGQGRAGLRTGYGGGLILDGRESFSGGGLMLVSPRPPAVDLPVPRFHPRRRSYRGSIAARPLSTRGCSRRACRCLRTLDCWSGRRRSCSAAKGCPRSPGGTSRRCSSRTASR